MSEGWVRSHSIGTLLLAAKRMFAEAMPPVEALIDYIAKKQALKSSEQTLNNVVVACKPTLPRLGESISPLTSPNRNEFWRRKGNPGLCRTTSELRMSFLGLPREVVGRLGGARILAGYPLLRRTAPLIPARGRD